MKRLKIDPEIAGLICELRPEEKQQLEENIKAEGCRDPLVVWAGEGILLDGHNRLEICKRLEIEYQVEELEFASREEAMDWIDRNQLGRRNLTPDQFRFILGRIYNREKKTKSEAGSIGGSSKGQNDPCLTAERIAADHGVSPATVKRAGKYAEDVDQVRREEPEIVARGEKEILARAKELQKEKRLAKKSEIEKERAKIAERAKGIPKNDRFNISACDLADYGPGIEFDAIITDPPYPKEFLPLYGVLAKKSLSLLKNGGILVAMCGQSYLDQIYRMMSEHLKYYWTACYLTPGQPTPLRQVQVNTTWKPLLVYVKPGHKYTGPIFGDVCKSEGNDKDFHKWGQSVSGMDEVLRRFALPGQTILDPFCGAGTTGISAVKRGCIFHGIDIDQANIDISISRISEVI